MASHLATEQGKFLPNPRVPPGETSYLADGATVERATKGKGTFVRSFGTVASRGESEVWFTFANLTRTRAWGSGQALSLAHLTMITNTHKHKQTNTPS